MADAVLFNVAGEIIGKLASPVIREIALLWNLEDELEKLKSTVCTVKGVLLDAEEQQMHNHEVKVWLGRLKDVFYDAEDLLDEFSTEALRRLVMKRSLTKTVCAFFSGSNQIFYGIKMARKIRVIRENLNTVSNDRKFLLKEVTAERQVRNLVREQSHSSVRDGIIGRENDKEEITKSLLKSDVDKNNFIVTVVGIGGIGKTALAQLVFDDEVVKRHFELRIWVCVTESFDVETIIKSIIEFVTSNKVEALQMSTLVNCLKKEIEGKRYLLVLDDVWNEDHERWLFLEDLLKCGAPGSKLVVTTRTDKVAKATGANLVYHLGRLSKEDSWLVFKEIAFEKGQELRNQNLVAIGKEIVEKCFGVPLIIRIIGSMLYCESSESEWLNLKNNEFCLIDQEVNKIFSTLLLSYSHLPSHLKHCFTYCRLFPKDHWLGKQRLVNLWMAQGFISSLDYKKSWIEGVAHVCFMELLQRCFFQEAMLDDWGNVVRCRMHNLMHDLAGLVAGSVSTVLNMEGDNIDKKCHHVSFDYILDSSWQIPAPLLKAKRLRTFFLPVNDRYGTRLTHFKAIFRMIVSSFKRLRVLDLHNMGIEAVPSSIEKLKHLRYLDLSWNTDIKYLPNSITLLHNLQTLELNHCAALRALPGDIKRLVNLRHLGLGGCESLTHMPLGLGKLTCLQILPLFVVDNRDSSTSNCSAAGLAELHGLNNLTGLLEIRNLGHGRKARAAFESANLKAKKDLRSLTLEWGPEAAEDEGMVDDELMLEGVESLSNLKGLIVSEYGGTKFPTWMMNNMTIYLPDLMRLELRYCRRCENIPRLDNFSFLKHLVLIGLTSLEYIDSRSLVAASSIFFPCLEYLWLENLENLKGWWKEEFSLTTSHVLFPSFPRLLRLYIDDCPNLTGMPLQPHLIDLSLGKVNARILKQQLIMVDVLTSEQDSCREAAMSSTSASKLKELFVHKITDLECMPNEFLQNLRFLEKLYIHWCTKLSDFEGAGLSSLTSLRKLQLWGNEKLRSLPRGIQSLSLLEELNISDCSELDLSVNEDGIPFLGLRSLRDLHLKGIPKLESLPDWLQHCTSLHELHIESCQNLESLPEWMSKLSSLQVLEIQHCPTLTKRCKKITGVDWAKISHIPYIRVERDWIQQRGH